MTAPKSPQLRAVMGEPSLQVEGAAQDVRDVVMVYKNHLDIGFTESVAKVTHDAIRWMLPTAIQLDRLCRDEGLRFVWTTPSWVIWEALETLDGEDRAAIEQGVVDGSLAWHALPFTPHVELLDEQMLDCALDFSRQLDERFGMRTAAAKLSDIPGFSVGLVPALARAGVQFLHIGVNHMSALCDVPPAFRWRHGEDEVVVFYGSGYGGAHRLPGDAHVLLWRMVGDNCEVPSLDDVRADYARVRQAFPAAEVRAGRLDDYLGNDFAARTADLPVVEAELGDSWIRGTGSDPWKTQRFRALQRLRRHWVDCGIISARDRKYFGFAKNLCMVAEHTWGVNFNAHNYHDNTRWNNPDFDGVRHRGYVKVIEASWQEQRDYLELACASLDPDRRTQAEVALAACVPEADDDRWEDLDPSESVEFSRGIVRVDPATGAIESYRVGSVERVAGHLGLYRYQSFDQRDCERFCRAYNRGAPRIEEFTKQGLDGTDARSAWWLPSLVALQRRGDMLRSILAMPEYAIERLGAPREAVSYYGFPSDGDRIDFRLVWKGKRATRLPEAGWWTFQPVVDDPRRWRLHKCGLWVDPHDVVQGGGRELHGVQDGARNGGVLLRTLDAHLVAPGRPQLYRFNECAVDCSGGMHLNLYNNCWGTNFVMWCEDDLQFRASLHWDETRPAGGAATASTHAGSVDR